MNVSTLSRSFLLLAAMSVVYVNAFAQEPSPAAYSLGTQQSIQFHLDSKRDEWQKPDEIIRKLELKSGDVVADIGCGPGYFTLRLAQVVGPTGKVYAVDIDPEILDYVEKRAKTKGLRNVVTILAEPYDPKLSRALVDMVFFCNSLHWIKDRATYYPLLIAALKPNGRLADVDWKRTDQTEMTRELESAGFRLVQSWDFLKDQYFMILER